MIRRFLCAGVLALVLPIAAPAAPVTWAFSGVFDEATPTLPVGNAFDGTISFDTDAALIASQAFGPGFRYQYDASSLVLTLNVAGGPSFTIVPDPAIGGVFYVRDDSSDLQFAEAPLVDGYSFNVFTNGPSYQLILRGTDLTVVNGPGLPADPDPRLPGLEFSTFILYPTGVTDEYVRGRLTSLTRAGVAVSEPGTLALLALGLFAIAGTARARRELARRQSPRR